VTIPKKKKNQKTRQKKGFILSKVLSCRLMQITVFEHQRIRIGMEWNGQVFTSEHLRRLVRFHGLRNSVFYNLLHDGVKFNHFVGVIQMGDLTIEILPKTEVAAPETWRRVLLDMLAGSGVLNIKSTSTTGLSLRPNFLLDYYFGHFLDEVEKVLKKGLQRNYRMVRQNERAWKGQLDFHKQIQHNAIHQERVFVRKDQYDYVHPANQLLLQAVAILPAFSKNIKIKQRALALKNRFPTMPKLTVSETIFEKLSTDKMLNNYRNALNLSYLILQNYQPDFRPGGHPALAILFDMNQLFENFIYHQLVKVANADSRICRQEQRPFWLRRRIRPDLVIRYRNETVVLDTKWKVLPDAKPAIEDLKQIFIYNQYFNAHRGVLIYPGINQQTDLPPQPFQPIANGTVPSDCAIKFVTILKNNKLNPTIGLELLNQNFIKK